MFPEIFRLSKPDIHTAAGQRQTRRTLKDWEAGMKAQRRQLKKQGYTAEQVQRGMDPAECFRHDLMEQIEWYERAKRGILRPQTSLECIGLPLIAARIARGWSRKALAERLEIPEPDVIRYERNEYHAVPIHIIRKVAVLLRLEFDIQVRLLKNGKESSDSYAMMNRRAAPPRAKPPSKKP